MILKDFSWAILFKRSLFFAEEMDLIVISFQVDTLQKII